jgi:pyruvate formate lyase activating enzyme
VLGGAVISGGEPTLYQNLPHLIASIKSLGLAVKLDTNGMLPEMLEHLLQAEETAPDYIALDLKTAPARYGELAVAPLPSPAAALKKSAALICGSGIPHEFRTIALPDFITEKDIDELAPLVDDAFWYIRPFRPGNCLDPVWDAIPESDAVFIEALVKRARDLGKKIGNEEDKKKA